MKVYLFYLIGEKINNVFIDFLGVKQDDIRMIQGKEYSLYAFTNKKEYKNEFKDTRNMEIFYQKTLEMDEYEFDIFSESRSEYLLDKKKLKTKNIKDGVVCSTSVDILCTSIEYDQVTIYKEDNFNDVISDRLTEFFYEESLDDKLLKIMNDKLKYDLSEVLLLDDLLPSVFPYEEYPNESVVIDEIALFIALFSNILCKKER